MEKQMSDFREKTTHGDTLLPVSYYCCHIPDSFRSMSFHWHEEAEITYIEEGSATYTINFQTYTVQAGDLLFISPHLLHGIDERQGYTMTSHSLVFHLNFLGCLTPDICTVKYLNPLLAGKAQFVPVIRPHHPGYQDMKQSFLAACRVFSKKEAVYELRTKSLLSNLLSGMYLYDHVKGAPSDPHLQHTEEKLKEVLTYIQSNYHKNLSIQELAAVCHFSETHFMNFFRKCTGATCVEYINRYRLSLAAAALQETDSPIMDVALEHGFRNVSYFNKLFKKRFGDTPMSYRKRSARCHIEANSSRSSG